MTDPQFQKLLDRLSDANGKYFALLEKAEKEFERRYGTDPSACDCDSWIDTFHLPPGSNATVAQVKEWAEACGLSEANVEMSHGYARTTEKDNTQ